MELVLRFNVFVLKTINVTICDTVIVMRLLLVVVIWRV